jgi:poly-gamma-glutamate capsule biosynthesis protein CapA/YwtB (metallophosphatase superfamily)
MEQPPRVSRPSDSGLTLFLDGDVMTARDVGQVLPHPGDPRLHEPSATSALTYVDLAEEAPGSIGRPVDFAYIWGDALGELAHPRTHVRIANLETSVTSSDDARKGKSVTYRMHPGNVPCLGAARDAASLVDATWLRDTIGRESQRFRTRAELDEDRRLELRASGRPDTAAVQQWLDRRVRLLGGPCLWCWEIADELTGDRVESSRDTEWCGYPTREEAETAGRSRLVAIRVGSVIAAFSEACR